MGSGSNSGTCVVFPWLTDQDSLEVARQINSNSQDLQEFHLWCYSLLIHTVFPDILYKASNLMVLHAPLLSLPRDVTDTTMTPTAQAIFQLPWATTSLRVLELHILCIPRPDISLVKQAKMEELVLGNGHYYKGQVDILGGLSKLRVLDLSRTVHRVGVPEFEWMRTHWDRIERVSGLFNQRYPGEPGVRDWLAEQDSIWGSEHQGYVFSAEGLCSVPNDSVHRDAIAVFHC
ncbi:MAG: hypothetical protein BYD32DRAFT_459347 [Podila humilis]|nr:MAG: hypothetical protein BYD32DRAFT_459347 [Podila humilis]